MGIINLKNGIYEQIINQFLQEYLQNINERNLGVEVESMDAEEAPKILSQYVSAVVEECLHYLHETNGSIGIQIDFCNDIIKLIYRKTLDERFKNYTITDEASILMSIFDRVNTNYVVSKRYKPIRPVTSISHSSLFTGAKLEPSMLSELKKEIASSDQINMLVSFIKWSGIRLIMEELENFTLRGQLRIITTSYMGATDYKAIEYLSQLPNTEIKISYDTKRTRLHAKTYLFFRETGFSTAYVGSSNLSNAALSSGLEWNMKVTEQDQNDVMKKIKATFETYWNDDEFELYKEKDKKILLRALKKEKNDDKDQPEYTLDIRPYSYQKEILDKLQSERKVHGYYKNLVVAATGTGKTVVSAFDYKRFCKENPQKPNRLLFVAHREEILKQSLYTFRAVLKDANFGDWLSGNNVPEDIDHLFITIQSLKSKKFTEGTTPDFYDFIIVDEFHHAAAPSYQELLEYYDPKILLGLTATPERMDGKDIVGYFHSRIAAEIRLFEAIDRKLLSPFQYFGVTDEVDLNTLKWSRGGYDAVELNKVYTGNTRRAELISRSIRKYVHDMDEVIGLGFCVSVQHAEFMATYFNQVGIPSICLHGQSDKETREQVQKKLINKEIHFIFVVDLYNEGIDIPEVNTVLFLRPTESLTVFIQQLGRGLRLSENKECLTVLDFIGQAHRQYSYEEKFKCLLGNTRHSAQKEIQEGFLNLPKGSFIQLEKKAKEYVLQNIHQGMNNKRNIIAKIKTFSEDSGMGLNLSNFLHHYHMALSDIYPRYSFARLCVEAGVIEPFDYEDEEVLTKALGRLGSINSRRWIEFLLQILPNAKSIDETRLNETETKMLLMFYYTIWQKSSDKMGFKNLKEAILKLSESKELLDEMIQVLQYRYDQIDFVDEEINLGFACPLDLHCTYTRDQILAGLGYYTLNRKPSHREGVLYMEEHQLDAFLVTLNKAEKDYSPSTMYNDYSINETLFHWQSQSTTSEESKTGQRYIHHKDVGSKVILFVREYKKDALGTAPYIYLGTAEYVRHNRTRTMNIIWRLHHEIPGFLVKKAKKLVVS